jgi:hypothetical protein
LDTLRLPYFSVVFAQLHAKDAQVLPYLAHLALLEAPSQIFSTHNVLQLVQMDMLQLDIYALNVPHLAVHVLIQQAPA